MLKVEEDQFLVEEDQPIAEEYWPILQQRRFGPWQRNIYPWQREISTWYIEKDYSKVGRNSPWLRLEKDQTMVELGQPMAGEVYKDRTSSELYKLRSKTQYNLSQRPCLYEPTNKAHYMNNVSTIDSQAYGQPSAFNAISFGRGKHSPLLRRLLQTLLLFEGTGSTFQFSFNSVYCSQQENPRQNNQSAT